MAFPQAPMEVPLYIACLKGTQAKLHKENSCSETTTKYLRSTGLEQVP